MAPTNITSFPVEILVQITSYLTMPDYGAFRLSCRQIEESVFRSFAHSYFRQMQFMRTDFSLQALIGISKSRLSPFVKHVFIGTEILDPGLCHNPVPGDVYPRRGGGQRSVSAMEIRYNIYNTMCANQVMLLSTGHDQQMLAEAFSNLKLETVGIRSHAVYGSIPINLPMSFGTSKIFKETAVELRSSGSWSTRDDTKANASCVFSVLNALAKSTSRPKRFETIMGGPLLGDDAFIIPIFMEKDVLPVMAKFESLDLKLHGSSSRYRRIIYPIGKTPYSIDTYYLRKFLSHLTHLERLCLKFSYNYDGFFNWLGSQPSNEVYKGPSGFEPPSSPAFTCLREIDLTKCKIPIHDMLNMIRKFSKTLRKLSLHDMTLTEDSLPHDYDQDVDDDDEPKTNLWAQFVSQLARIDCELNEVSFRDPAQPTGHRLRYLRFGDDISSSPHFTYAGPFVRERLETLSSNIRFSPVCNCHRHRVPNDELTESEIASDEMDDSLDETDGDFDDMDEYDDYDEDYGYHPGFDPFYDEVDEVDEELAAEMQEREMFLAALLQGAGG
ncbi:Uu.00g107840.m01.CDS01 [Anthostomella pinea]|uniref:Uu.00g107840.m01.CDS01 n=1 Tax=Anthostomella pinea TaxID=933095 RepID=A0AAI8YG57_9PEZI|nr:Uu.00g107840.m01.CDS01 [Anthostomella pinea]